MLSRIRLLSLALPLPALPAAAQWPSDPATNLPVADAAGNELLPHNGVLVSDRGFTSV